ncbi:MAG TPA: HD-GYP domain-containing protein [Candidatus Limnocylindria bacterium]|nr:HD-GYP domain-containing protein [Candidatus Limnocylindria bacterium]
MNANVVRLILATVAAAILVIAAALFLFPLRAEIAGPVGLVYWTAATLAASAMPIRLPRGSAVSVASAPILASLFLGGPAAAVIVAAIGTTDERELRGEVPWYGTLYNHASAVAAVGVAGILFELLRGPASSIGPFAEFVAAVLGSVTFLVINWALGIIAVAVRTQSSVRMVWAQDVSNVAPSLGGLAPLAWLMAQIFQLPNGVGWWATPLFVVPLFTTRMAYARYVETREMFEQTITALSRAVDARDRYTREHSSRVSHIAEEMCRVMRLSEHEIERIKWAGLLHDVGKIGIRDHILLKEGPLDKAERTLMNRHPSIGAEIVKQASQLMPLAPLVETHHEWFNGSGYPLGKEALDIPLGARILTIADAYEAMTSSRPYRKTPLTHEQAIDQLEKFAGIQFDPDIVPILVNLDRSILDRPPDGPEQLPTMLNADEEPEEREEAAPAAAAAAADSTAASTAIDEGRSQARPALASDDVP